MDSKEQLEKTYIRVQEEMSGAKIVDGALVQGTHPTEGVSTHHEGSPCMDKSHYESYTLACLVGAQMHFSHQGSQQQQAGGVCDSSF